VPDPALLARFSYSANTAPRKKWLTFPFLLGFFWCHLSTTKISTHVDTRCLGAVLGAAEPVAPKQTYRRWLVNGSTGLRFPQLEKRSGPVDPASRAAVLNLDRANSSGREPIRSVQSLF
jgi:hypothetical protein